VCKGGRSAEARTRTGTEEQREGGREDTGRHRKEARRGPLTHCELLVSCALGAVRAMSDPSNAVAAATTATSASQKDASAAVGATSAPALRRRRATLLCLGDLGRSPRMQYHATAFRKFKGAGEWTVELIGYEGQGRETCDNNGQRFLHAPRRMNRPLTCL
jgi:hypothetical protein